MTRAFGIAVIALACVATTSGGRDAHGHRTESGDRTVEVAVPEMRQRISSEVQQIGRSVRIGRASGLELHSLRIPFLAADGIAIPEPTIESQPVGGVTPIAQATATSLPAPNPLSIPERICEYSWPCGEALRVAECESTFNPLAENGVHLGLFQVSSIYHSWRLYPGESLLNPDVNMRVAHGIWMDEGWFPWSCQP